MDIFDVLSLIGGLCLFLFGMNVMGEALERRAGGSLQGLLNKLTQSKTTGFLTGLGVTAVIQSSSATTVMVVGFVNSGLMSLKQAIHVIMGANVGTTVTAWILSLGGISGDNLFLQLLKPTSFTPVLAFIGTVLLMFGKSSKKKDTGTILLGFSTLMFGMDTMSSAVGGLADVPQFQSMFIMFQNPVLGVLVGALLTAVIQSSSASVGILQALSVTGQVTYGAAVPIIMGQNIGTCITAMLSSLGTNKNAKRAAVVHLFFNILGTTICLPIFWLATTLLKPAFMDAATTQFGIAVAHSTFNVLCTAILLPMSGFMEKLAYWLVPDDTHRQHTVELDERLLAAPSIALDRCNALACEMAETASQALLYSLNALNHYEPAFADFIHKAEAKTDRYEDLLGTYLIQLSRRQISDADSLTISKLLKAISDFERIADHSVNLLESAQELHDKSLSLTPAAQKELNTLCCAIREILQLSNQAFTQNDLEAVRKTEALEQVVDDLKAALRNRHILRLKSGECSLEAGFIWGDLLTDLERTADHCSNIAICVWDANSDNMNVHESLRTLVQNDPQFKTDYCHYSKWFALAD